MRQVKLAGFVVASVFCLGAISAAGQITDDTHSDQMTRPCASAAATYKRRPSRRPSSAASRTDRPLTYGGLWSELLENGSFEEGLWSAGAIVRMIKEWPELEPASKLDLPLPWEPLDLRQGNRYEPQTGDAANSSNSLLVMALPAGKWASVSEPTCPCIAFSRIAETSLLSISPGRRRCTSALQRNDAQAVFADRHPRSRGRSGQNTPLSSRSNLAWSGVCSRSTSRLPCMTMRAPISIKSR